MPLPDAALAHYAAQQRQVQATVLLVQRLWRQITGASLDEEWQAIAHRLTLIVAAAQLGAASAGAAYVPAVLAEIGRTVDPDAEVNPQAWSGIASDGRPLDSLLYSPVVQTKESLAGGMSLQDALQAGSEGLKRIAATQVQDAGRGAASVAIAARQHVGYVRLVSAPCCQRCAVLAGKTFRWNAGFQRHPRCDCRHIPTAGDVPEGFSPTIPPDQIKDLTEAQRKAIADGGNVNQVINSNRKRANSGMTTAEGTTRRGVYGGYRRNADGTLTRVKKGEKVPARLTPEAIYRLSASRTEALDLLKRFGYLL
jgi:hypothetical protein